MESETIILLKRKFAQTDECLKNIGLQLCALHKDNQILKAKIKKLEGLK